MSIKYNEIADLLTTTYDKVEIDIVDLSQEMLDYIVVPYFMKKKGGMRQIGGGVGVAQILMIEHGGRSRFVGEYDQDVILVIDHLTKARVDFCLMTDNVAYSIGELRANRGKERITNVIAPKKRAMQLRVIETIEYAFFQTPDVDDDLTPWGLKYWIVKSSAAAGYNGGYPSGFTTMANLNLTKVPQFRNYTDNYTSVTKDDLILKMRRAHRRTKWRTPKKQGGFTGDTGPRRFMLANEATCEEFENIGEGQNENLGRDISPYNAGRSVNGVTKTPEGEILFKNSPFVYGEYLDADSTDPIYGIDMKYFHCITRKGDNMSMGEFGKAPNQHRVIKADFDHAYQFLCSNRRAQWVISK